jgi:hypothetical protein
LKKNAITQAVFFFKSHASLWIILYLILVSSGIFLFWRDWVYDDPFITYRYANNLIHGLGFVYNPGEHVLSTTTPLFTLLLASLAVLWPNIPQAANLVSTVCIAVGALFLFGIARLLKSPLVGIAALLLYPTSLFLLNTLSSETPLYIALALAAYFFYLRENYSLAASFSGLVVLTRPDGVLVPAILAVDFLLHKSRSIPWKAVALFLILTFPWFFFAWVYFGSPIPTTLFTKQHQASMAISKPFLEGLLNILKNQLANWHTALALGLAALGAGYLALRARQWLVFIAWPLAYFVAYTLLGVTTYFWYYAPLVPGYILLIGLGLTACFEIAEKLFKIVRPLKGERRFLPVAFFSMILITLAVTQSLAWRDASKRTDPRYAIYRETGNWLRNNTPPGSEIGTLEVGIIGYYADRPIIDFAGLIQPDVASYMASDITYEDTALYAIERYHPQYLVLHEGVFPGLEKSFTSVYCHPLKRFDGQEYHYRADMMIYACDYPG